jgi:hypothetical protein
MPADTAAQPPEIAVLQSLRPLLLGVGYFDCERTLHLSEPDARRRELLLASLPPRLAVALRLFRLGATVTRVEAAALLPAELLAALSRIGLIVDDADGCHTAGLALRALEGQLIFFPLAAGGLATLDDDVLELAARLVPPPRARCASLFGGVGAIAAVLAVRGERVVMIEENRIQAACAELNVALNGLGDRVEVRSETLEAMLGRDERFDFAAAVVPVLPFPGWLALPPGAPTTDDGLGALRATLDLLARALASRGAAQLVASAVGDGARPRLCDELHERAVRAGLQVAMNVAARVSIRPGEPLFELMAERCAVLGNQPLTETRSRLFDYFARLEVDTLYRFFLAITRDGAPLGLQLVMQC